MSAGQGRLKEEATFVVGNTWVPRPVRSNCSLVLLVLNDVGCHLGEQILAVSHPRDRVVVSSKAGLVGCRWEDFDMEQLFLGAAVGLQAGVPNAGAGRSVVLVSELREEELVSRTRAAVPEWSVDGLQEGFSMIRSGAGVRFASLDS